MGAQPNLRPVTREHQAEAGDRHQAGHSKSPYRGLIWMGLIHLPLMYLVMFTMVYSMDDVVHNFNTLYMAGMMVAPMIVLMPLLMKEMYPSRRLNWVVYGSAVLLFAVLFGFMRYQTFVDDRQFLRSMIPHHSGAVLMCERAKLQNPEIRTLCSEIIEGQKAEIEQMRELLKRV